MLARGFFTPMLMTATYLVITEGKLLQTGGLILVLIPAIYSYTLLAVNTHRIILLPEDELPRWGSMTFLARELRFVVVGLGVSILCSVSAMLVFIPKIGWVLAIVAVAYIAGRFSLILPATAIDSHWSLKDAWYASDQHQLLMSFVAFGLPIMVSLFQLLLSAIPYSAPLAFVLSLFTTVLLIVALSLVFEDIRNQRQGS
jgi:hypothetical protein